MHSSGLFVDRKIRTAVPKYPTDRILDTAGVQCSWEKFHIFLFLFMINAKSLQNLDKIWRGFWKYIEHSSLGHVNVNNWTDTFAETRKEQRIFFLINILRMNFYFVANYFYFYSNLYLDYYYAIERIVVGLENLGHW